MTELTETVMAFCREVMGWEHPVLEADGLAFKTIPGQALWPESFAITDLNVVMAAVRTWCHAAPACLTIEYDSDQFSVIISLYNEDGIIGKGSAAEPTLSHALMSACVEAARKLKAGRA